MGTLACLGLIILVAVVLIVPTMLLQFVLGLFGIQLGFWACVAIWALLSFIGSLFKSSN